MGYGFVIDQRKCIGCHACTVACKAENEVPLGDFRTWVRYTEKGSYPSVKRHFTVLRCNHCDAAPCVEICPVQALEKRVDAIVDLNRDQCIGCKSCMQGCPYDALYLNDDQGVVEKCHYCAHRTEMDLEPACVVVCPEQAIVAGDTDDPDASIARLIREEPTSQRRLDKGTKPRVWYVDALEESLEPNVADEPQQWLWSDRKFPVPELAPGGYAPDNLITTLNNQAKPQWGWHVWLYLVTKNLSAGAMLLAPFAAAAGLALGGWTGILPEIVALLFLGITNVLLIDDLGRPERFWKILLQPNTKSWLVKGAWVLTGFGLLTTASAGLRIFGLEAASDVIRWVNLPVALLTASYSAFLFAQCKGRDLWIEPGLFWMLALRAATFAAGLALVLTSAPLALCGFAFAGLALANVAAIAHEEKRIRENEHWTERARQLTLAAFQTGGAKAGFGLGAALALSTGLAAGSIFAWPLGFAALLAVTAGMTLYERSWITAGQAVPNS